jgi:hypothetical protein
MTIDPGILYVLVMQLTDQVSSAQCALTDAERLLNELAWTVSVADAESEAADQ